MVREDQAQFNSSYNRIKIDKNLILAEKICVFKVYFEGK